MKRVVICGITSAISKEFARSVGNGNDLFVAGRNAEQVEAIRSDLSLSGDGKVSAEIVDFNDLNQISLFKNSVSNVFKEVDLLFICFGTLSNQERCEGDLEYAIGEFHTNFLSQVALLQKFVPMMSKGSTIAVVTSVAGDRGRGSNFYYGSAKGGLSIFLSGLRAKLSKNKIYVLDVRPGFVDTPMTSEIPKNFLFASPKKVSDDILRAIKNKKGILYTPFFWRYIMLIIRSLPMSIFNRLKL